MRWLLSLPLIPLLVCGGMCIGGAVIALVLGKKAVEHESDQAPLEREDVS